MLRRKSVLLVLDNFEQVSAAASLVTDLLGACPGLRILVTSQEPLRLRIEQRQRVHPLAPAAAVELFLQRAHAIDPDFDGGVRLNGQGATTITAICLRLDCLPLAIELVAAQLELFSPTQLLTRLQDRQLDLLNDGPRDLPAHQRTLRNAIHRSYALLQTEEQELFRALGVFAGGCTVEALAAVLGATTLTQVDPEATARIQLVTRALVRKSLVQQQSAIASSSAELAVPMSERFTLLTTLAAYAGEQLMATNEEQTRRRNHAAYYLALAQSANQQMQSATHKLGLDQLTAEHDNLRAALAWALPMNPPLALQLVAALAEFWATRGHDYEARHWIDAALKANPALTATRAAVLVAGGNLARRQADYAIAQAYMAESITIYQTVHDKVGLAIALRESGWLEFDLHDKALTIARFEESLALYRQLDDKAGVANLLLALVHVLRSDPTCREEVEAYLAESLTLSRTLNQSDGIVRALQQQGELALATGNYAAAGAHFREALAYWRQLDSRRSIAWGVAMVGEAAALQGDLATAEVCYTEAHQIFVELGNKDGCAIIRHHQGDLARQRGDSTQASQCYQESIALCQALQNPYITARCLVGLGGVALMVGDLSQAATLLGAAQRLFDELPPFLTPADQADVTGLIATTHQRLDAAAYRRAWQAGQAMTTEEAVAVAVKQ